MAEIRHLLRISVPPSKVYKALSTQAGLSSWWTHDVMARPETGTTVGFGFMQRKVVFRMRIEKLEPDKRVEWKCVGGEPEWEGTDLFFDLKPDGDETILNFGHLNWKSADGILPMCSFDWAKYLMSLRSYVETGKGEPHTS